MTAMYLRQQNEHQVLEWHGDSSYTVLLESAMTSGQLSVGRVRARRGGAAPYHVHVDEDEMFFMISGRALLFCGDEQHELDEGGVVFLPRHVPHSYRITSEEADFLLMATPGGIEQFFRAAGRDVSEPRPEGFEVTVERMVAAGAQFGQTVLGPPR